MIAFMGYALIVIFMFVIMRKKMSPLPLFQRQVLISYITMPSTTA